MNKPYTYLIGWSKEDRFYYGVRYAKTCTPDDLWKTYFTSSKFVKEFRERFGEPDVIQVRKIFVLPLQAKRWEEKVLKRLNVIQSEKWINQSNNFSFRGCSGSWNTGLTKETSTKLREIGQKISQTRKENPVKGKTGKYKRTLEQCKQDSWNQLQKHNPEMSFETYDEFCSFVFSEHQEGKGVWVISKELNVDGGTIKTALKHSGVTVQPNQSWSKIKKRLPNFPFQTYEAFCEYCYTEIKRETKTVWSLHKELQVSEDAVKRAIRYFRGANDY